MDFQVPSKIKVRDLNGLLTCIICNGYFIDATTISECLHSFCRTCIVRYLQINKYCPICEVQVHKAKPLLSIRSDQTLQDIVYKVVPALFKNEMKRRRDFYSHPKFLNGAIIPVSSEKRGDVAGCDRLIFTPEDLISISMEYCSPNISFPLLLHTETTEFLDGSMPDVVPSGVVHRRYFQCPGAVTIRHLKKLLHTKYGLTSTRDIDIMYMHDQLRDEYTLIDLAYIYSWRRNVPMRLFYKFQGATSAEDIKYNGPCIIPSEPLSVCTSLSTTSSEPSAATAPSSHLQRPLSPPASPQMATEPDNSKLANPRSAAMQNRLASNIDLCEQPKMTTRSEKPKTSNHAKDKSSLLERIRYRKPSDPMYGPKSNIQNKGLSPRKFYRTSRNDFKRSNSCDNRLKATFYENRLQLNDKVKAASKETKLLRKNSL